MASALRLGGQLIRLPDHTDRFAKEQATGEECH